VPGETTALDRRVLILPPTTRDGEACCRLIGEAGIPCEVFTSFDLFTREITRGCAAIMLSDVVVMADANDTLGEILATQPVWSDLPVIVLTTAGAETRGVSKALRDLGNVSLIERPVRVSTLLSVVRTAIRARMRQYQVRDYLIEKQAAERALMNSEADYREALAAAELGHWELDLKTSAIICSPRCNEVMGLKTDNTHCDYGSLMARIHPDDRTMADGCFRAARKTDDEVHFEARVLWHDGSSHWVWLRGGPRFDVRGRPERYVGLVADITERKRLMELQQQARAEAEAANNAKDRFLAVLSHELRTPLSPVSMGIALLEAEGELAPRVRDMLAMMKRNLALETQLIDDLLDLSRVISGKLRLKLQSVRVHDIVRHAVETCAADAHVKRLNLRMELNAGHHEVTADPARLQQVFWNLLKNAVKFTPEGRSITVRSSNPSPGKINVEVIDQGIGIAPAMLPTIFTAFDQGDTGTTREFGGLGLGLAISKAVIDMHGGKITGHSDGKGFGATFRVELDTVVSTAAADPAQSTPPASTNRDAHVHVLLVEDHADTAGLLAEYFRGEGYRVSTAGSVAAAMKLAMREKFDVVVSDIGLPDASGYDLMRELRDLYKLSGIALSGYGMESDIRKSREVGFVDHIVKPVDLTQLSTALRRALMA
jgi:PAS domain S-box-containing protein